MNWTYCCWMRALNVNFSIFCALLYRTSLNRLYASISWTAKCNKWWFKGTQTPQKWDVPYIYVKWIAYISAKSWSANTWLNTCPCWSCTFQRMVSQWCFPSATRPRGDLQRTNPSDTNVVVHWFRKCLFQKGSTGVTFYQFSVIKTLYSMYK